MKDHILMGDLSTKDRIFNIASELFKEKGYNEVTINDILWCSLKGEFDWKGKFFNSLENMFDIEPSLRKYR